VRQELRPWERLRPAKPKPLTPEKIAALKATGGVTEDFLAELQAAEVWINHKYTVQVTRREDGSVAELSIRRNDRKAAHDWRDFQRIKNEIAGDEIEAVELYPAMSRLMDTANQYYIFCLPPGEKVAAGLMVTARATTAEAAALGATQRELPSDWVLPEVEL